MPHMHLYLQFIDSVVDHESHGMITDDEMSSVLVHTLPEGARLTAVMDCCHSGTGFIILKIMLVYLTNCVGLDLPFSWNKTTHRFVEETNPYHSLGDVQLFSGCEDEGVSADSSSSCKPSGGAMTTALCDSLRSNPCPTYVQLIAEVQQNLNKSSFKQQAQLTSSQAFDVNRPFLLDDIVPNSNATIGRLMRRKFPPRRKQYNDEFAGMLGVGAAAVGGLVLANILFS
jgi:hypothetical protein